MKTIIAAIALAALVTACSSDKGGTDNDYSRTSGKSMGGTSDNTQSESQTNVNDQTTSPKNGQDQNGTDTNTNSTPEVP